METLDTICVNFVSTALYKLGTKTLRRIKTAKCKQKKMDEYYIDIDSYVFKRD